MEDFKLDKNEQQAVLVRFEEKKVILKLEDGLELSWPADKLPAEVKTGDSLRVTVSSALSREEERKQLAKDLINEILEN